MKFYGNGTVWDAGVNKSLCRFNKHGEFETEDKAVIKKLTRLGYKHDEVVDDLAEAVDIDFEEVIEEVIKEPAEEVVEEVEEENEVLPFEPINYAEMTNRELRELLEEKGHTGLDRKNKKQLLKLLEGE